MGKLVQFATGTAEHAIVQPTTGDSKQYDAEPHWDAVSDEQRLTHWLLVGLMTQRGSGFVVQDAIDVQKSFTQVPLNHVQSARNPFWQSDWLT